MEFYEKGIQHLVTEWNARLCTYCDGAKQVYGNAMTHGSIRLPLHTLIKT